MTEIERIIKEGILPKSFFEPETICDFYVDENRKKIWAVEIDMLIQIDRVCKKYGLEYFLMFGSMLGAVRHHGFIPWDDDLDIGMSRDDYEELLKHDDEFKAPYFLQTPISDNGYAYAHAKLRNSNTSAIDYPFMYQGINLGVFVDILPYDRFELKNGEEKFDRIAQLIIENSTFMRLTHPYLSARDNERVKNYKGGNHLERYNLIQQLSKQDNENLSCENISFLVAPLYGIKRDVFFLEDFIELQEVEFHGLTTYIPIGYNRILNTIYPDYMKLPPKNQRNNWHTNLKFNCEIPYRESLKKHIIF